MKTYKRRIVVALCGLLFLQMSCSQVEISGRQQFNIVPDFLINSMALQSYNEFLSQSKLSRNIGQYQMVKRVGNRIRAAVERYCEEHNCYEKIADYEWEFNLVEDPNVNAWCMPGGKVVVYTGILPIAQNDAGLAVVMGHEIAHAFAKHGSERMSQALLVDMGGIALSTAIETKPAQTQELFKQSYGIGTQLGIILPYSRVQENEADHLGLIFMAMAGYDPHEAVAFWERMAAEKKGAKTPEFLSTHPADATRIQNIKDLIPEAMQYYREQ
jgi:predicted Zn-dependent protease